MMSSVPNDSLYYGSYGQYARSGFATDTTTGQEVPVDPSVAPAPVSLVPSQDTASFSTQAPAPVEAPEEKKNGWLPWALGAAGAIGIGAVAYMLGNKGAAKEAVEQGTKQLPEVLGDTAGAVKNAVEQTPEAVEKVVENTAKTGKGIIAGIDFKDPRRAAMEMVELIEAETPHSKKLTQQIGIHLKGEAAPYNAKDLTKALEATPLNSPDYVIKTVRNSDGTSHKVVSLNFKDAGGTNRTHEFNDPQLANQIETARNSNWDDSDRLAETGRVHWKGFDGDVPNYQIGSQPKTPKSHQIFTELLTKTGPDASRYKQAAETVAKELPNHSLVVSKTSGAHHVLTVPKAGGGTEQVHIPNFKFDDHKNYDKYDFVDEAGNPIADANEIMKAVFKDGRPSRGVQDAPASFTIVGLGKPAVSRAKGRAAVAAVKPKIQVNITANAKENVSVGLI